MIDTEELGLMMRIEGMMKGGWVNVVIRRERNANQKEYKSRIYLDKIKAFVSLKFPSDLSPETIGKSGRKVGRLGGRGVDMSGYSEADKFRCNIWQIIRHL